VTLRNFVNGKHTDPCEGGYSHVVDPSTGEAYAAAPVSSPADVDEAMRAARDAFETWRDTTPAERSLALLRFADAVERRAAELTEAECRNTGKPLAIAGTDEVPRAWTSCASSPGRPGSSRAGRPASTCGTTRP
jgi:betaine-aldehyde dehydrogenase